MRSMMKFAIGVVPALLLSTTAFAHSHTANGQLLANGQNHPLFVQDTDGSWDSCESYGAFPNSSIGAAWYGLETAITGRTQLPPERETAVT